MINVKNNIGKFLFLKNKIFYFAGDTPLHRAAFRGFSDIVKVF